MKRAALGFVVCLSMVAVCYIAQATTLNTHFKHNGYTTISLGKVFHFPDDNRDGWSEKP